VTEEVTKEQKIAFIKEARRLLALFHDPVWAVTPEQTDEEHLAEYNSTLARTREHFSSLPTNTAMNAVMGEGDTILAFTGNSPDAPDRARAIVGFVHSMPYLLNSLEALLAINETFDKRVTELIEHNTAQLMENREQRRTIRALQAREKWLLEKLSDVLLADVPEFS
jgi:hypothetical protein